MTVARVLVVSISAAVIGGCGGADNGNPDDVLGPPRDVITTSRQLLVGELAEAILVGGPADAAVISIDAPAPKLDWNIHGHPTDATITVVEELGVASVRYTLAPSAAADWFLLVRNRDTMPMTIDISIELHGDMQWTGFQ